MRVRPWPKWKSPGPRTTERKCVVDAVLTVSGRFDTDEVLGWIAELFPYGAVANLTDRRGECIHSGCPHWRRCFVEHSIRRAAGAKLVVANHALVMVQAALGGGTGGVGVVPAPLVVAECFEVLVLGGTQAGSLGNGGRHDTAFQFGWSAGCTGRGTWVVHTPSPWAIVASRWTWLPSSSEKTRVSAAHSSGNARAT